MRRALEYLALNFAVTRCSGLRCRPAPQVQRRVGRHGAQDVGAEITRSAPRLIRHRQAWQARVQQHPGHAAQGRVRAAATGLYITSDTGLRASSIASFTARLRAANPAVPCRHAAATRMTGPFIHHRGLGHPARPGLATHR